MAQLDDKTLQNLNKRLKEMDEILASDYRKALDLGKAFTQGFSTEQIDAFLRKLGKINRADAAKLNVMFNLVDINGKPITVQEARTRIKQITNAINKGQASTSIKGTQIIGLGSMTNELKRYKDALSVLGMSTSQQFDLISRNVKKVNNEVKGLRKGFGDMLPTLQRLASAFGVAFSVRGLAQFGKKLIETRGEFERQQVALRSILQNKQLADEIWDKTMQAALQSPFTAMQLTTYTKQLAAYRIETDKLFDTTKRLADVSAGLGVDMQRLILAYGQVKAANYLRASEIRQFTEAGVNVLGELRDYFNDIKGMSVDTAQVMEMVTKRLVTFEDVEAIFKRMTDKGGIFYEMQYVQSQTVRGQIAKLHDAYDQMLNSIGQANEGALKNMVSLLNSIVKNWQEFKTVIDLIAWPLLISFVYKFSRGLMTTAASAVATSASMNKLTVAGARTQLMFKRLFATIAAHPFIALGAAVAAVGVALLNHAKHVRDINKRYEDLMLRTYETQKNLDGLSETIQNNLDTMKEAAKGSEAYNEASRENDNIVKKLKDQYPELLQDIDLQKDGYEKLIEKIKEYNDELENQIRLEYAARAGFWQDDLTTNIADIQEAQRKREMQFLQNRNLAETEYLKNGKKDNDIWWERIRLAKTWEEQVEIIKEQNKTGATSLQSYGFVVPGAGGLFGGSVETNLANLSNNIKQEALVFNDIIRDQLETINEDLGDDIQQFIKDNETQVNELFKDKEGAGWKLLNKQITKFFTAKGATDKETREAIQNFLNEYLLIPIQLDWNNTSGTTGNQQPIIPPDGKNKENASKLISLIKEMRGEYDKLSKSAYGYAKSEEKVRDAYADSVKAILEKAGVTKDYDFTTNEGMVAALDKVLAYANKLGPEAAAEVQKYIDQLETEIEINAQVRIREDFGKQMEKAFNDYELTLDIEKLNLPSDVLADMFDIESVDLAGLRKKIEEGYERLRGENGGNIDETDRKNIEGYIKKIDDMERKQQRERIKDYAKYLEYEMSERAKITMEYVRKISDVQTETSFSSKQKDRIVKGLTKEMNEKLAKQDWDDFKGSEVYVQMMEDLEKHGSAALVTMRKELEKIRDNAKNLSPRALKEVVNALAKIKEIELNRSNPFTALNQSRVDMQNAISKANAKSREEVYAEADAIEKLIVEEQDRKRELDNIVSAKKEGLRIEEELSKLYSRHNILDYAVTSADNDALVQSNVNALQAAIKANVNEIENLQTERAREGTTEERVRQIDEEIGSIIEETNQYREQKEILEKILQLRISLGLIDANAIKDEGAEQRQEESESKLESLAEEQRRYQEAIDAIDRYNAQVQRAMQFVDEWAGKVQGLWSEISNLSTAYEGEFGDWVAKWGNVIDVSLSQVSKLSKAFADFRKTRADYLKSAVKKTTDKVSNAAETAQTATTTLATNAETEAITVNTLAKIENAAASNLAATGNAAVGTTATVATPAVATFGATLLMAMGWVGLIIAALEALFAIIKAIAGANDEGIDQQIEDSKDKVDELTKAYERLEKQIEKTWDTVSYMREYNEEVQNLQQQIEEANNQIAAAQGYKNEDKKKEAIEAAEDAKQEALDALEEIKQKQIEVFGGIGEDNYRSAAEGFVDAWKSAFLETGDGLQGLQDHFDEFLQDWFTKQLTMKYAAAALKPLFAMMDAAVDQYGPGGVEVIQQELDEMREWAKVYFPQIADELEKNASIWGLEGEGGLSGLAAGIQGMTEEQANILEAYWNSVRGYTASIDQNVATIVGLLSNGIGAGGGGRGVDTNPQLVQLEAIAGRTNDIYRLLDGLRFNGGEGLGFRVYSY